MENIFKVRWKVKAYLEGWIMTWRKQESESCRYLEQSILSRDNVKYKDTVAWGDLLC